MPSCQSQAAANKLKAELETYGCPPVFPSEEDEEEKPKKPEASAESAALAKSECVCVCMGACVG